MAFSEAQVRLLSGKLPGKHVRTREQRGMTLSYIEGWHAIDEANRIFGFDGWDRETLQAQCVWEDGRRESKACAYAVRVRIKVRAGESLVQRDGSGVGHGTGATLGEAHESALKEAETDATKRALTTFGNPFGLALYDKQQLGVRWSARAKGPAGLWNLIAAEGDLFSTHTTPEGFCAGLREAMNATTEEAELQGLWERNAATVGQLRSACPDLKNARGNHYADLLEKLHDQRTVLFHGMAPQEHGGIDKSALALPTPRRIRDVAHRRLVAAKPCLVCGRSPAQAHHLRFLQPRSLGSKVSDEFTVPLCGLHHRALHDVGDEEGWWKDQKIDARRAAEELWQESSGLTVIESANGRSAGRDSSPGEGHQGGNGKASEVPISG